MGILEFSSGIFFCLANSRAPRTRARELPGGNFLEKTEGPGLPGRGLRIPVCFPRGNSLWFVGFPNCRYGFRHSLFPNCRIAYIQGESRIAWIAYSLCIPRIAYIPCIPIHTHSPAFPVFPIACALPIPLGIPIYSRLPMIPDCRGFPAFPDSQQFPIPSDSQLMFP